ncbi:HAD-IA family hydrolase [Oceanobacillus massiliensis]|uniref:HAD family hydrolase n=1 Tax=Oceanobacillus massiliensis TaxID=1465765 RepID=UPI00301823FE
MIRAVIFDLDGTLLNRDASVHKFIENQYERLIEWLGHIPKENYISRFLELDCRGYVWKDKVYQQLIDEFNINRVSWKWLLQDYITEFHQHCIPFPNLIGTLEGLRNSSIRLGMITNGKGQFQMDNIRALGIENYFDTILISEWEGMKKPNPEIFKKALSQMNVSRNESMYVGDHPENDVDAARNIGMCGVWKRDKQWDDAEADFIIDDLTELRLIIREIKRVGG